MLGAFITLNCLLVLSVRSAIRLTVGSKANALAGISMSVVQSRAVHALVRVRAVLTAVGDRLLHTTTPVVSEVRDILIQLVSIKGVSLLMSLQFVILHLIPEFKTLFFFRLQSYL
jgi:hypothetical protein